MRSSPCSAMSLSTLESETSATLKAISTVIGKQWVTVTSEGTTQNTGRDRQGRNSSDGQTYSTDPTASRPTRSRRALPKAG